jgi:hypothetical protein
MEKIICSLEEWDSIINYYRPNGSSKTWYLNELNELNRPLMWGMWNIFSEDGKLFDVGIFKSLVTTEYSKKIQYVPYDQIGSDKHIYIINVWNLHFFTENFDIGFKCISQKYIDDIKKLKEENASEIKIHDKKNFIKNKLGTYRKKLLYITHMMIHNS